MSIGGNWSFFFAFLLPLLNCHFLPLFLSAFVFSLIGFFFLYGDRAKARQQSAQDRADRLTPPPARGFRGTTTGSSWKLQKQYRHPRAYTGLKTSPADTAVKVADLQPSAV